MSLLISNILNQSPNSIYIGALLILVSCIANVSRHQAITKSMEFSAKSRFTLLNMLYQKLLKVQTQAIDTGKLIGLATADISMLEYYFMLIFQIFVMPISLIFGSIILYIRFDGLIGLIPLFIIMLIYPLQIFVQKQSIQYTKLYKQEQDKRIKLQSEFIDNIKVIKMYNVEDRLNQKIQEVRKREQKYLLKSQMIQLIDRSLNFFAQIWASMFFIVILYVFNYELDSASLIATIQQLQYFKVSCVQQVSYGIQSYLNIKMIFQRYIDIFNNLKIKSKQIQVHQSPELIKVNEFSIGWKQEERLLKSISIQINPKDIILITGKIGSGKTSFLLSLIDDGPLTLGGYMSQKEHLTKSYVEQDPILFEDTIQNNITFGKLYIEELYQKVIEVTCLKEDIQKMQQKDQTIINDRVTTISGGQKTRIALARALYSLSDILILDDPFSSLDAPIQIQIYKNLIEFLQSYHFAQTNKYPAVVLTSHSQAIINQFQKFYLLQDGLLVEQLNDNFNDFKLINLQRKNESVEQQQTVDKNQVVKNQVQIKKNNKFYYYFANWTKNKILSMILLVLVVLMNFLSETLYNCYYNGISLLKAENQDQQIKYIIMICILAFVNNYVKYILNSYGCLSANSHIHNNMIRSISQGKMAYFDQTAGSTVLTKFSTDLSLADNMIPVTLYDFWELGSYFLVSLFSLVILQIHFIYIMIVTILLNQYILGNYRNLIIKSQELDQQTKGPLLDLFKKTIAGLRTISVFEQQGYFLKQFNNATNNAILSNTTYYYSQRLFGISIDFLGLMVQQCGIVMIFLFNKNETFTQALLLLMIFNENQQWFLRQSLSFVTQINCVDRMQDLIGIDQEDSKISEKQVVNLNGNLNFSNVYLKYNQDYALSGLTLNIKQGEKVGIIGRTGAGKSSIISIIFRLYDIEKAEKFEIDGYEIRDLCPSVLRRNISIIPQQPIIFNDTFRFNVDIFNQHSEQDILNILRDVRLYDYVQSLPNGLNSQFGELSQGQKQLVSLSRVLLQDRPIIIMDEATSNLDSETDLLIKEILLEKLRNKTVITIAHKTQTIKDYDKIVKIENGRVSKVGAPFEILEDL
ncbi:unnamed protein product (macronuclear) [Paramecium tetraurelia]|uniref:ABC transporter family protein n=1 Tax=Paramecium tetraurelia TaxID=5888 RepID=A0E4B7_PARTE|nr:uncharacterized protein GSPATT00023308001 [Paramecium tetraurelia]CAK90134.1 unnamed protein product [Paramecium tetraurelia]|eukprot:XP_001457531.1 hypothetical protein (macronuclear) [Paramecium tetraurelia strain d4-2]